MKNKVVSNNPFSKQCNVRAGAGPIYSKFCAPTDAANNAKSGKSKKEPCFGPYDNSVGYVWIVDLNNGNHLAYVDCDYVD